VRIVHLPLIISVLQKRHTLRGHDRLLPEQIQRIQHRKLAELRQFAYSRSGFYQQFHKGLFDKPLSELPSLSKSDYLAHFNEISTDSRLRLHALESYMKQMAVDDLYLGRYWLMSTSGSTGKNAVFVYDKTEWAVALASYMCCNDFAGVKTNFFGKTRLAIIGSKTPWHQSARVGHDMAVRTVPRLRLDATDPVRENIDRLNEFQPTVFVTYPSVMEQILEELRLGRVQFKPLAVLLTAEPSSPALRQEMSARWGVEGFDCYGATETGVIAAECAAHKGLHVRDDLLIVENVDEKNQPVPPGELGSKILVTSLFSRTLPLIRYEITDCVRFSRSRCECGRPYGLIEEIQGRRADFLRFPAPDGSRVTVHPNTFKSLLEPEAVEAWQVIQRSDGLHLRLARPRAGFSPDRLETKIQNELARQGSVSQKISIEIMDEIPRGPTGKLLLIVNQNNTSV